MQSRIKVVASTIVRYGAVLNPYRITCSRGSHDRVDLRANDLVLNPYRITCSRGSHLRALKVVEMERFKPLSHYMQSRIRAGLHLSDLHINVLNPYRITCSRG